MLYSQFIILFCRGEKLYLTFPRGTISQEQHVARFCCWMISLFLLAGALTVAALIGGHQLILMLRSILKPFSFSWSHKVTHS